MESNQPPLGVLSLSTAKAKTSVPQVKAGERAFWRLTSVTPSTTDKGQVVKFAWDLTRPATGSGGRTINPGDFGSKFFQTVYMYAKEGSKDPTWFTRTLAEIIDALLGTGDEDNEDNKPRRPELFTPDSTLGNATLNQELVASLLGKEMTTVMKANRNNADETEFGKLQFLGDVKA